MMMKEFHKSVHSILDASATVSLLLAMNNARSFSILSCFESTIYS